MTTALPIEQLLEIMAKLRDPKSGCPWDIEQDFSSIAPYTIEEAYEVYQAIDDKDMDALKNELGDLLLQVVFHAQMASETDDFTFDDVARSICDKMTARHPHVFGNVDITSADAQTEHWETLKAEERKAKAHNSILDDIPQAFPALLRAHKLQKRAARVGFDWPNVSFVYDKLAEELAEVKEAADTNDIAHIEEEIGDLLFVSVNLARHYNVNAETALRAANKKFEKRFHYIEQTLASQGRTVEDASLSEMDTLWNEAKAA